MLSNKARLTAFRFISKAFDRVKVMALLWPVKFCTCARGHCDVETGKNASPNCCKYNILCNTS